MLIERLRQDFQLALVVIFGIVLNVMIVPFAIYRFYSGQLLNGSIDLFIVGCVGVGAVHAYRHGSTARVAMLLVATNSLGCIAIAYIAGPAGPLWLYGVILTNFLLVERKRAVVFSAIGIGAVAASPLALPEFPQTAAFIGSSVLVCAFAYIYVWRTEIQRKQLEELALVDPLTGATNRRGMNAELEIAIATSTRDGSSLGVITFDLDHFKKINDRYGHDQGDSVLVQVADVVRLTTRKTDRLFRLGGEEFALLIADTSPTNLYDVAEKVRLAIQQKVRCGDLPVTASLGASILRLGESVREWQARADAAMYRAKNDGRNLTILDEPVTIDKRAAIRRENVLNSRADRVNTGPTHARKDSDTKVESLNVPPSRPFHSSGSRNGAIDRPYLLARSRS